MYICQKVRQVWLPTRSNTRFLRALKAQRALSPPEPLGSLILELVFHEENAFTVAPPFRPVHVWLKLGATMRHLRGDTS